MAFDEVDLNENDELAFGVARDIECQWDLYLIENYSDKEMRSIDLAKVSLPNEWFLEWHQEMNKL